MRKLFYIFSMMLFILTSCKDFKVTDDTVVTYEPEILEKAKAIKLHPELITTDFSFSRPLQMDFVADSLIVVYDEIGNKNVGQIVSRSGYHKGQFGVIGKGNGEMIFPENFSIGKDRHFIYFFDLQLHHCLKYNIADVLANQNNVETMKNMTSDGKKEYNTTKMLYLSDTDFIAFGYDNRLRIQSVKGNKIADTYTDYPNVDENEENKWSIWTNMTKVSISPNGKHLVIGTAIGAMFEVFDITNGKIEKTVFKAFHKPIYKLAEGARPACVVSDENTVWGFTSLYCTDKSFWGVMGGKEYKHRNVIYEFDYSGELLNKYEIDNQIETFAVTPNREIYFITTDNDGNTHLMKSDLNNI